MIWRIFRKDWKLLWPIALGVAGMNLALRMALARMGLFPNFRVGNLVNLLVIGGLFGVSILITLAVQQDPVPGVRQDWLVAADPEAGSSDKQTPFRRRGRAGTCIRGRGDPGAG